ncbi:DsbA family oxidoreductase [Nocardia sp. BMG51109]|uniref:DsbA family oxidoreductase n=1 Tax=Nocardia sp. BMG51109 TaxID=1056816 RepID=UPI000464DBB2|nr:DsbA family oxidoreductase [Nocardia sp. BMG51109]
MTTSHVDIWIDLLCPFCYIAKRNFETALTDFAERDQVVVRWHALELDPEVAKAPGPTLAERHQQDFGGTLAEARGNIGILSRMAAASGLTYDLDRAYPVNSFDAHRLAKFGDAAGLGDAVRERIMHAYTAEGAIISDADTLARLGAEAGLDEHDVRTMLRGNDFADAVHEDEATAQRLDINAVPTFVVDGGDAATGVRQPEEYLRMLAHLPLSEEPAEIACQINRSH